MKLVFNKLKHKQVLNTDIWVSDCGTSVYKVGGDLKEPKELKIRINTESNSLDKYTYPSVVHMVPKLPKKVARLVLLAWSPTLPEDYSKLRAGYKDGDYMNVAYSNLLWSGACLEPEYPVRQLGDYNLYISKNGEVVYKKHGNYYVALTIRTRALGRVVYHSYKNLTPILACLQLRAWGYDVDNITDYPIKFLDGDKLNTSFENLALPTFSREPNSPVKQVLDTNVYINRNGVDVYWKYADNNWRTLSSKVDKDGYIELYHGIEGLTRKRHRLVALAWKEVPDNWEELHINHLDNTPGSDDCDNLEWCTYMENQEYSRKQGRSGGGYAYVKDKATGEIIRFNSLNALSLGYVKSYGESYLRFKIKKDAVVELPEGFVSRNKTLLENM